MPLTRRSKLREVWRHPVGHELLQNLMRQLGRNEKWLERPFVGGMSLQSLDRVAGAGFCDMVLEMAAHAPEGSVCIPCEQKAWWKEAIIYQIFLPSFMDADHDGIGDLAGVCQRLPYLENLGVGAIWLWGLLDVDDGGAVRDYEQPAESVGDMADFEQLVQLAHARGIKVLVGLDISATSEEHPWFANEEKNGYYVLQPGRADIPPNNWTRPGGSGAWKWFGAFSSWGLQLAGRSRLDLNWENAAVREEITASLQRWQTAGADGFCFGPVNHLSKNGLDDGATPFGAANAFGYEKYSYGPRLHRYLRQLRTAVPLPAFLAGEMRGVGTEMAKTYTAENRGMLDLVLDASHLALRSRRGNEEAKLELADLKQYYVHWQAQYAAENWMALFFETPHTARLVSRVGANPLYRAILAKLLLTWLVTMRGTPVLYQGEELGLANARFSSPDDLRFLSSQQHYAEWSERAGKEVAWQRALYHAPEHAMLPMPWSSGPAAGFTGAVPWMRLPDGAEYLNVAAQMEDGNSVWHHTQKLIELRKQSQCLLYGSFNPVFVKNKKVFCYFRILEGEKWYVEMNLTEKETVRPGRILRTQKLVLSNYDVPAKALRPYEANVYRCE